MPDKTIERGDWELQYFDHSWGGWRGLRLTLMDDKPAQFHDQAAGEALMSEMLNQNPEITYGPVRKVRLFNKVTGAIVMPKGWLACG